MRISGQGNWLAPLLCHRQRQHIQYHQEIPLKFPGALEQKKLPWVGWSGVGQVNLSLREAGLNTKFTAWISLPTSFWPRIELWGTILTTALSHPKTCKPLYNASPVCGLRFLNHTVSQAWCAGPKPSFQITATAAGTPPATCSSGSAPGFLHSSGSCSEQTTLVQTSVKK